MGVLLLSGALVTSLNAQPRQGRNAANSGQRAMAALDLTEEQKTQMEDLRLAHYKEMKPLKAKQQELVAVKRTLMSEPEVDVKGVKSVIDQQTDLQNTIQKKRLDHQMAMKAVLTDQQIMRLDRMKSHAQKRRASRLDDDRGNRDGYGGRQGRGGHGGRAFAKAGPGGPYCPEAL